MLDTLIGAQEFNGRIVCTFLVLGGEKTVLSSKRLCIKVMYLQIQHKISNICI